MHFNLNVGHVYWIAEGKKFGDKFDCSVEIDIKSKTAYMQNILGKLGKERYLELTTELKKHGVKWIVGYFPTGWLPFGFEPLLPTDLHYLEL